MDTYHGRSSSTSMDSQCRRWFSVATETKQPPARSALQLALCGGGGGSMYMCACTYVCMYIYVHVYVCMCVFVCMCIYIYALLM